MAESIWEGYWIMAASLPFILFDSIYSPRWQGLDCRCYCHSDCRRSAIKYVMVTIHARYFTRTQAHTHTDVYMKCFKIHSSHLTWNRLGKPQLHRKWINGNSIVRLSKSTQAQYSFSIRLWSSQCPTKLSVESNLCIEIQFRKRNTMPALRRCSAKYRDDGLNVAVVDLSTMMPRNEHTFHVSNHSKAMIDRRQSARNEFEEKRYSIWSGRWG